MKVVSTPQRPYLAIALVALMARATLAFTDVPYINAGQKAVWSWVVFPLVLAGLALGAWLFPPRAPRFGWPILIGTLIAGAIVVTDVIAPVGPVHIPLPLAIPFYVYGAILLTVLFHFVPLAIAMRIHQGRAWLAIVIAAIAMSEDGGFFLRNGFDANIETARHLISVAANLAEALFILRYGLLGGIAQRLTTYAWWHILWPAIS